MKAWKWILSAFIFLLLLLVGISYRADIPVEQLKAEYTDEASRFVTIDGLEVHYKDEGTGPPLVLVHGTASSLHTWNGWTKAVKNDFRVIRMDLPAFGITGPNPQRDYSIKSYVHFLDEFLEALQIDSLYLAGNSLGGKIAWNYTLAFPKKVKKLILIDASGYPKEAPQIIRLARNPVIAPIFKRCTPKFLIRKNLKEVYGDDSKITDALVTRYYKMSLREGNRQAFIDRVSKENPSNIEKVKNIETPTLILWGEQDIWIPLEHAHRFHEDIPNSELIVYKGAGHIPMEEIPEETAEDAKAFLLNE